MGSTSDKIKGTANELAGKAKQAAGKATDNPKLRAEGRMTAAGEAAYARRTDTKSSPYSYEQSISAVLTAPELRAFRRDKPAWKYFDAAPPSYRKVILHWITMAKKPETRAKRLSTLIAACAAGKRLA